MRGLRSFAYGQVAVSLAVVLASEGLTSVAIGALITVGLLGDMLGVYLAALFTDRWGRRRTLFTLALLMALTGAVFAASSFYPLLLVTAFAGTLGASQSESAPFLPIEQAMAAQLTTPEQRTTFFAHYNLAAQGAFALGALAAALPNVLQRLGVPASVSTRIIFIDYALLALAVAALILTLPRSVEAGPARGPGPRRFSPPLGDARATVYRLAALFSVDALAGGLVVQSLMALYFHVRFGLPLPQLAALFFGANAMSALSFLAAAPLARRFGLLNTMVFTHLPSNVLLALAPFAPTFPLAVALLLTRQALSQMDVPTRQAYSMALVPPEARTATASVTSLARGAGSASSPVLSGLMLQGPLLALGLPFIAAGALKAAYDVTLWLVFRRVTPHERG